MSTLEPQRHLLFGLLAFQNAMIDRTQLLNAFSAWMADKRISIDQWLVTNGILTETNRDAIQRIVNQHIERFGTDLSQSFAEESNDTASLRRELEQLAATDAEAKHALTVLSANPANQAIELKPLPLASEQALAETVHGPIETTDTPQHAGTTDQQRFRIIREHAKGGLGVVFVANDTQLRREVALKQIRSDRPDTEAFREKFTLEAEVTGQLEHPGIVPVYALGTDANGRPYYAMRFIKGEDLKSRIRAFHEERKAKQQPLDDVELRKLLRRLVDVCNAMSYAHERGVLHRDLKPANVMLGKHGETLVVDWGLAKPMGQKASDTDTTFDATSSELPLQPSGNGSGSETRYGTFIGTPAYAPPEQVLGQLDRMSPQSDVYSLGAMLYELLTGQTPVTGKSIDEIISKVIAGEITRPGLIDATVPSALEAICLKAMSVKSEHRYITADAMRTDLENWLDDQPVAAYPEPFIARARRWTRNHPAMTTGIAASTVLGLLAAIGFAIISAGHNTALVAKNETISKQSQELQKTSDDLQLTNEQILQQSKEFRLRTARNYLHSGIIAFDSGKQDEGIQTLLAAYVLSKEDPELHKSVTRLAFDRATLGGRRLVPQIVQDSPARSMAFSGDGRLLLTGGEDGVVRIYNGLTTQKISEFDASQAINPQQTQPLEATTDGTHLLFCDSLWETKVGKQIDFELPPNHSVTEAHFTPDGSSIYGIRKATDDESDIALCAWSPIDGALRREICRLPETSSFDVFPNGLRLVTWGKTTSTLLELPSGREAARLPTPSFKMNQRTSRVISPDSLTIALLLFSMPQCTIVDASTFNVLNTLDAIANDANYLETIVFRPDGRQIASTEDFWGSTSREYKANSYVENEASFLHSVPVEEMRFSPDGSVRTFRYNGNILDVHEVHTWAFENIRIPDLPHEKCMDISFSSDGTKYALRLGDEIRIHSTSSHRLVCPIINMQPAASKIAFSDDGRRVASTNAIWDGMTGIVIDRSDIPATWNSPVCFARDNQTRVYVDPELGTPMAFSRDGMIVLTDKDQSVAVWDLARRDCIFGPKQWLTNAASASFRADLPFFAVGYFDGSAIIYSLDSEEAEIRISTQQVVANIEISPDGSQLITNGSKPKLWDPETGHPLYLTHATQEFTARSIAITPDGNDLYTCGDRGNLHKWNIERPVLPDNSGTRQAFLELLTGYRVDEAGLTSRLSESDQEERFVVIESEPDWWAQHLDFIKRKRLKWHRYQLSESIAENDHFGASFHLNQLRKKLSGDAVQLKSVLETFEFQVEAIDPKVKAAKLLSAIADFMLGNKYRAAEEPLSQLQPMPDASPADQSHRRSLAALCSVHRVTVSAAEDSVLDAFRTLLTQTELTPSDPVWQAMLADLLIHASHGEHALMLSELNQWATDRGLAEDPQLVIARRWVEASMSSEAATIPEIDVNDPLHAASPVSRYFAARHLRLKGDFTAASEQAAQALALLDQGWLSANASPASGFLEQELRARLELLRSAHTMGFTGTDGVKTLPLGGLVADSVRLEGTNADQKLAGWLSENSELAVLSDRKLFAVNLQAPTVRREIHDFGDAPNFGDLTVSADGSFGWLESNAVQRRQHETSESKGSGFDPSYSDDGSTFVWSSWGKDGNYQFELDRGAEHFAFTIPTHPTFSMYPSLSSDGRQIAYRSTGRDGTPQIGLLDTTTGQPQQLTDNGESNLKPCFSPDGRFMAFLQSHVSQNPSQGRIRLVVRDLQSGVETVVANDVQYVRAFWKPIAKG